MEISHEHETVLPYDGENYLVSGIWNVECVDWFNENKEYVLDFSFEENPVFGFSDVLDTEYLARICRDKGYPYPEIDEEEGLIKFPTDDPKPDGTSIESYFGSVDGLEDEAVEKLENVLGIYNQIIQGSDPQITVKYEPFEEVERFLSYTTAVMEEIIRRDGWKAEKYHPEIVEDVAKEIDEEALRSIISEDSDLNVDGDGEYIQHQLIGNQPAEEGVVRRRVLKISDKREIELDVDPVLIFNAAMRRRED
ncbi:MAG: hypothetical protein ABEJ56_00990 [Candidatus Nanohaloarchaea archaeon]